MKVSTTLFVIMVLCGSIAGAAFGEISTSNCAWTIEEGRQGRARCGLTTGPECPNVIYSRRIGQGIAFGGIGPEDRLLLTTGYLQDNLVLLLRPDGSTDLRLPLPYTNPNWSGFCGCAIDDEHLYLSDKFYGDMELSCRDLDGAEVWHTRLCTGNVIPVDGRGLAVAANYTSSSRGKVTFFDSQGSLISEGMLLGSEGRPAFNSDGVAAWAYYTWEYEWPFGADAEWFCASELNPAGVSLHSAHFPSYCTYPLWSIYYAKVNESGNVFVSARKKVVAFADISLQTMLWEYTPDGFTVWEDACGDPSGGWYIVCAEPQGEDDSLSNARLFLIRIGADGSLAWEKEISQPAHFITADPTCICDAEGNVYLALGAEVLSYDREGVERWCNTLAERDVRLLGMDSRGTVYVRRRDSGRHRLFAIGDGEPEHSRVRVKLPDRAAGDVYQPGEELVVLLQPYNFGEDEVVDGYLAIILPNGAVSFYTSSGFRASPTPWFPNVYLPNSYEMIDAPLSLSVIPEGAPQGTYTVIAGFTTPGTLTPVDELFPLTFQVVGR